MAGRVVLHYFNGRGKMESIRWLLTVAEIEVSRYVSFILMPEADVSRMFTLFVLFSLTRCS